MIFIGKHQDADIIVLIICKSFLRLPRKRGLAWFIDTALVAINMMNVFSRTVNVFNRL